MSPEHATAFRRGQPPRRGTWMTGGAIASLALVLAAGIVSPAAAAARDRGEADVTGATGTTRAIPITEAQGPVVSVPAHSSVATRAVCPAGQTAVSGGWITNAPGVVPGESIRSTTNTSNDTWFVIFDNPGSFAVFAQARAYCSP